VRRHPRPGAHRQRPGAACRQRARARAGGKGLDAALADPALLAAIRRLAARAERVVSVCTGAFLLAAAGLLDGLHATTHWRHADALARRFPGVRVEPDAIFVNEGKVWTSAGVTAGLDLALALVEADRGAPLALEVAQALVFYLKRPGGQSQFSVPLRAQAASHSVLDHVRRAILDRPGFDWRIEALADQAHTSPRHLRRLFRQELGMSPRAFIQGARLELAQRLLGDSRLQIADIARRCGYDSAAAFSRRFEARMGAAPMAWRARFQVRPGQAESGA
jgi:transcriptional regulator GlxA family with amidase domain